MNIIHERDTTTIRQTVKFNAPPEAVYEVLMDSQKHESLSGEKANISREIGGAFNAWGEHISGFNLVLQPGRRIVQAWRCAPKARITSGGGIHPENCRLIW